MLAALFRSLLLFLLETAKDRVVLVRKMDEFFGHALLEIKLGIEALDAAAAFSNFFILAGSRWPFRVICSY